MTVTVATTDNEIRTVTLPNDATVDAVLKLMEYIEVAGSRILSVDR